MAKERNRVITDLLQLAHPVYLDTPMLVSFLASLENGVSYGSEIAERYQATGEGEGEGSAKLGLPSIATLLGLNLSAEGRYKRRSANEEGVESKFIREHTAASLFNRLRMRLRETEAAVVNLDSADLLPDLRAGRLVELQGEVTGNPLKQVLDLFAAIGPYFGVDIDEPEQTPEPQRPSSRTAKQAKGKAAVPQFATGSDGNPDLSIQDILRIIKREVERSPVLDLLMEGESGVKAVLTVSRELLSPEVEAYLIGGRFTVLAKTSAVLGEGEEVNLLRRTVFGFGGRELADGMFSEFNSSMAGSGGIDMSISQAVVDGPVVQLLPLAIYL